MSSRSQVRPGQPLHRDTKMDPPTYIFKLDNNSQIRATVISTPLDLDISLSKLFDSMSRDPHSKWVVSLDIEKAYKSSRRYYAENPTDAVSANEPKIEGKVAVIKLCAGLEVLVVPILRFETIPTSLARFFDLPDLTFVGIGIDRTLEALARDYGLSVRNAVDLGLLAATFMERPVNSTVLGLKYLANRFGASKLRSKGSVEAFGDWGGLVLTREMVEAAAFDAYAGFYVGHRFCR